MESNPLNFSLLPGLNYMNAYALLYKIKKNVYGQISHGEKVNASSALEGIDEIDSSLLTGVGA